MKTVSSKINVVAAVLALAALVLAIVGHAMTAANALLSLSTVVFAGAAATALMFAAGVLKGDFVGLLASLGGIAGNMVLLNYVISERILMIAGIFSYDSGNIDGWNVFYTIVACAVCAVLSCVTTMVAGFLSEKK